MRELQEAPMIISVAGGDLMSHRSIPMMTHLTIDTVAFPIRTWTERLPEVGELERGKPMSKSRS
jgi:hypothetical protein